MILSDLLPKLVKNDEYQILIADTDNRNIIIFNPEGYTGLSTELNARTVEEILVIDTQKIIKIYLEKVEEVEPEPTPDPVDPDNP